MSKFKKKFHMSPEQKVAAAQTASTIFSILGLIGTVGAFFVEEVCTKAAIDEAVDARLEERGL